MIRRNAWEVYSKTFAVCVGVCLTIQATEHLLRPMIPGQTLRWAAAFAIVQAIAILVLALYLLLLRAYRRLKNGIYGHIRPAIRDRVMALAFEGESWATEVPTYGPARHELEEGIAHAVLTLKASGRDRVARFALERGFVAQWVRAFSSRSKNDRKRAILLLGLVSPVAGHTVLAAALRDKYPGVRIEACRALLTSADLPDIDKVFRLVLSESLLTRALLSDDLKRHASYLLINTVPDLLEKATDRETARCFEILIAWKRALPSFDIHPWLSGERHRFLWPLVFALLPYVSIDSLIEGYLASALEGADLEAQCAAAHAAGCLRLKGLIPVLSAALSLNKRFALACATAIAQMGELGERHLGKIVAGSNRIAAALAMEALEHVTVRAR